MLAGQIIQLSNACVQQIKKHSSTSQTKELTKKEKTTIFEVLLEKRHAPAFECSLQCIHHFNY